MISIFKFILYFDCNNQNLPAEQPNRDYYQNNLDSLNNSKHHTSGLFQRFFSESFILAWNVKYNTQKANHPNSLL